MPYHNAHATVITHLPIQMCTHVPEGIRFRVCHGHHACSFSTFFSHVSGDMSIPIRQLSCNLPCFECCGCMQAAYAFKATYQNGGHGLNFSNLHDYNNHWIYATCVCAVETILAIALALYLEQVLSSGTGVRRHPLFFLKKRKSAGGSGEAAPRPRRGPLAFLKKSKGSSQGSLTETAPKPGMSVLRMLFRGQRPQQLGAASSKVIQVAPSPPSPLLLPFFCHKALSWHAAVSLKWAVGALAHTYTTLMHRMS